MALVAAAASHERGDLDGLLLLKQTMSQLLLLLGAGALVTCGRFMERSRGTSPKQECVQFLSVCFGRIVCRLFEHSVAGTRPSLLQGPSVLGHGVSSMTPLMEIEISIWRGFRRTTQRHTSPDVFLCLTNMATELPMSTPSS